MEREGEGILGGSEGDKSEKKPNLDKKSDLTIREIIYPEYTTLDSSEAVIYEIWANA